MTLFKSFNLFFQLVLGVLDRLADLASGHVGFFRGGFLARFLDLLRNVFRISSGSMVTLS